MSPGGQGLHPQTLGPPQVWQGGNQDRGRAPCWVQEAPGDPDAEAGTTPPLREELDPWSPTQGWAHSAQ